MFEIQKLKTCFFFMEGGADLYQMEQGWECGLVVEYLSDILKSLSLNFSIIDKTGYLLELILLISCPCAGDWTQGLGGKQVFVHKLYLLLPRHDFSGLVWYMLTSEPVYINLKAWMLFYS